MDIENMTLFILVILTVFGVCGYLIRKGYTEWNEQNPRKLPEITVSNEALVELEDITPAELEVRQFDFRSYQEYREIKIDEAVSQIHQRFLISLTEIAQREMWIGMRPEDMHVAIKSAGLSFAEAIDDEVIKEIVISVNESVESERIRRMNQ